MIIKGGDELDYALKDKAALVTGTDSQIGMGNAISLMLAKDGCDIASSDPAPCQTLN